MSPPGAPSIHSVEAAAYRIPTEEPESDGAPAWDSTTLVVVTARGGFEGAKDPEGGMPRPDPDRPGVGLSFEAADAEPWAIP